MASEELTDAESRVQPANSFAVLSSTALGRGRAAARAMSNRYKHTKSERGAAAAGSLRGERVRVLSRRVVARRRGRVGQRHSTIFDFSM